jgi:hypothetical protein
VNALDACHNEGNVDRTLVIWNGQKAEFEHRAQVGGDA